MSYSDVLTKAWSVVHCWRGLRPGQIGLHVIELEAALKAADPQELADLRQENEALRAGLAELQRQAEGLRGREAQLVSELAEAMKARGGVAV